MSIFDGPLARCEAMRTMILTDQTQTQCARENGCPAGMKCPLCDCFVGREWRDESVAERAAPVPLRRRAA